MSDSNSTPAAPGASTRPGSNGDGRDQADRTPAFFRRFKAIVDGGWLKLLPGAELAVLWFIFRHADNATGIARFMSVDRIAEATGLKPRTVAFALAALNLNGLVSTVAPDAAEWLLFGQQDDPS